MSQRIDTAQTGYVAGRHPPMCKASQNESNARRDSRIWPSSADGEIALSVRAVPALMGQLLLCGLLGGDVPNDEINQRFMDDTYLRRPLSHEEWECFRVGF